jgi:paraquat-inducible protein B
MMEKIDAATPEVRPTRQGLMSRISLVWLVPVLALAISLGVAWQSYSDRGVLIEVGFDNATGIETGKTQLRYRDVTVGTVERVTFSEDLSQVLAQVRVDNDVAGFIDSDAQFWVVRPQVSVRGISGLGTVLSGVYINGTWDNVVSTPETRFTGLGNAPLVGPDAQGTAIVLRARNGNQLAAGAPIVYKGIRVGSIEAPVLTPTGNAVITNGFIEAPYDAFVTSATRFWDTSGFSLSLGAGGVKLDVDSLASLVEGGVTFETLVSGGTPVDSGAIFPIYESEATARSSLFQDADADLLSVAAEFDGSVGGLVAGSEVRFRGIKVGEVSGLTMNADRVGNRRSVRLMATMQLRPGSLGLGQLATKEEALALLQDYVGQGLRARLTSANILTGALIVELVELPQEEPAVFDASAKPYPLIPSVDANLSDFNATAEGVFKRINGLKVEELIAAATTALDSISVLAASDGTKAVLPELTKTLEEARLVLADLREADAGSKVTSALSSAEGAAKAVETAAARLPALAEQLERLTLRTETVVSSYGEQSRLISSAMDALRNISEAADSLQSLARAIQRNPNSLLLGR